MFNVIGLPSKADLSFISDQQAFAYVKKFEKRPPADLARLFPCVSESGRDLFKKMLQFNPFFRPTAEECIKHPWFDEVRSFGTMKRSENLVNCQFENIRKITTD